MRTTPILLSAVLLTACGTFSRVNPTGDQPADPRHAPFTRQPTAWREIGRSVEDRPILVRSIGDGPRRVLWIGGIHGNETEGQVATDELPYAFAADPDLADAVTLTIVEDINPDGRAAGTRGNSHGIDLNRNYPAKNFQPSRSDGPQALSEPESRALKQLLDEVRPQLVMVAHSWGKKPSGPACFINFDGPAAGLAKRFGELSGYAVVPSEDIHGTPGSLGSFVGIDRGIPILTIEYRARSRSEAVLGGDARGDPRDDPGVVIRAARRALENLSGAGSLLGAAFVSTVVALSGGFAPVARHKGPPVYIECNIDDTSVVFTVTGEQNTLCHWFGFDDDEPALAAPLPPADVARVAAAVQKLLDGGDRLTVDGEHVDWKIGDIEVPTDDINGYGVPALRFTLRTSRSKAPSSIDVIWKDWERLLWFEQVKLPVLFRSFGDSKLEFLTPDEPECVWHAESVVPREPPKVVEVEGPPPKRLDLPLASIGIVLLASGGAFVAFRRRAGWPLMVVVALGAGGAAWFTRAVATVSVANPFYPDVTVPDATQAADVFDRLQRNVYAAFDARSPEEIYDLLAVSVRPALLDDLYGDVYESLILRGQGGAVCKVERIEVLETKVDLDPEIEPWTFVDMPYDDAPKFAVDREWNVYGVVSHWGHEHRRINHYRARYTVVNDGAGWKIAGVDVLDHSQVDKNG